MRIVVFCLYLLVLAHISTAQLASGPMLGYCEMKESLVWLQTSATSEVRMAYWETLRSDSVTYTPLIQTKSETAYVAKLIAATNPGLAYSYQLEIDGELLPEVYHFESQPLWQWRTDPPEFKLATGSCTYIYESAVDRPGKPYGSDFGIFDQIAEKEPDLMLWLGDNIYLREVDYASERTIHHRYSEMRKLPELQNLLHACPHYAIWDDHDFGPDNSNGSFFHKDRTQAAFELFWGNNGYGIPGMPGITGQFTFGDVDFFLLDNRYFRTTKDASGQKPTILGERQREWLIEALKTSRAPFKMIAVGGQFLSDLADFENHANYPEERDWILKQIDQHQIKGVVFLTGDRHHTELSKMTLPGGNLVYDLTCSPLTSGFYDHSKEKNSYSVPETMVCAHNFAILTFSGPRKERKLEIEVFDADGVSVWKKELEF